MRAFAQQASDDTLERTVNDLDHHPFVNQRTRIELEIGLNQPANAFDLKIGDGRNIAVERHDIDDACAGQDRQPFLRVETGETIAREQRPIDLFLAILPAAPLRDGWEERFVALSLELLTNDVFVARARPDGVPRI